MFKTLKFILAGIVFGIIMIKSQAASWYRIREMFLFESFHMFGIIGTAVAAGIIGIYLIKKCSDREKIKEAVGLKPKEHGIWRYLLGGTIFGIGWALTGACPGPMVVNFGSGYAAMAVVILAAIAGTAFYGIIKNKLPH